MGESHYATGIIISHHLLNPIFIQQKKEEQEKTQVNGYKEELSVNNGWVSFPTFYFFLKAFGTTDKMLLSIF